MSFLLFSTKLFYSSSQRLLNSSLCQGSISFSPWSLPPPVARALFFFLRRAVSSSSFAGLTRSPHSQGLLSLFFAVAPVPPSSRGFLFLLFARAHSSFYFARAPLLLPSHGSSCLLLLAGSSLPLRRGHLFLPISPGPPLLLLRRVLVLHSFPGLFLPLSMASSSSSSRRSLPSFLRQGLSSSSFDRVLSSLCLWFSYFSFRTLFFFLRHGSFSILFFLLMKGFPSLSLFARALSPSLARASSSSLSCQGLLFFAGPPLFRQGLLLRFRLLFSPEGLLFSLSPGPPLLLLLSPASSFHVPAMASSSSLFRRASLPPLSQGPLPPPSQGLSFFFLRQGLLLSFFLHQASSLPSFRRLLSSLRQGSSSSSFAGPSFGSYLSRGARADQTIDKGIAIVILDWQGVRSNNNRIRETGRGNCYKFNPGALPLTLYSV
ncbi:hypothetical protein C7M84_020185 [Penaeus vannamei]|uniref:Uncharacterized protein n=1 Tax=Penaeus vannamei TaxID=6689 RepID=A0A3R7LST0_PENVA|nr:hypothetical protein C7M84_020185 [Penaeus vannamei]